MEYKVKCNKESTNSIYNENDFLSLKKNINEAKDESEENIRKVKENLEKRIWDFKSEINNKIVSMDNSTKKEKGVNVKFLQKSKKVIRNIL